MRVVVETTPLLGRRTGVGRYVERLLPELGPALARRGLAARVDVTTWTARGGRLADLPDGVRQVGARVPARGLRAAWTRADLPRAEMLVGRCDVFHGTNFVSPPTRRAREVVTVHDLTYEVHADTVAPESLAYRTLVRRALERGAHVVTPSRTVADAVRAHYDLPADRVTATPLGVDAEWLAAGPSPSAWLTERGLPARYLLFVGATDPRKNLPRLLAAHTAARAEVPGLPDLVLAGPAGRQTDLRPGPGVHAAGWLDDGDLRRLVAGAAALVLPSLDEGFGLPVLEALACGRPVVASDIPALVEVSGGHAVLCDPFDVDSIAHALTAAPGRDGDADRAARRAWAREWTWARCADRTVDAYLAG